ncbi:MAG TPA: Na+/H+ antiporter NhaA, partial [Propionibacteriaceae bacterium]|nr:Na+/H+ antiporter NhaA [Propionibacteriaceae bacterium]
PAARAFARGSQRELRRIAGLLRTETVGGLVLVAAAVVALVWANSPWSASYIALRDTAVGPASLHLHLTLGQWAADGLLAVFFFLIGLELKHEFVAGDLRTPGTAVVPIAAAAGGVAVPVLIYLVLNGAGHGVRGWAVPAATDIAFALAVLAIISSHLPTALRTFLLTLAVVDDLIAIVIIAVAYTSTIDVLALVLAVVPVGVFAVLVQRLPTFFSARRWSVVLILLPLAAVAWALIHASGIHATIAGVVLGMCVPVRRTREEDSGKPALAQMLDHLVRPVSAGFVVPVFALLSAGVTVGSLSGLGASLRDPVTLGVILGLVLGKPVGIVATSFLVTRSRHLSLDESVGWADIAGVGVLAGIGFTVSLLVAELSFPSDHHAGGAAKLGVLVASLLASLLAAVVLGVRNRRYRAWEEAVASRDD